MKTIAIAAIAPGLAGQAVPTQHTPLAWSSAGDLVLTLAILLGALVGAALLGAAVACIATLAGLAASVGRQLHHRGSSAGRPTATGAPFAGSSAARPSPG